MKIIPREAIWALPLIMCISIANGQSNPTWSVVSAPKEIRNLISGKSLTAKDWIYYFRADGKMGYKQYDFISVREWKIDENGKVCMSVFSMPENIIACEIIETTNTSPSKYRMVADSGAFEFEIKDPSDELTKAVTDRAGPE